MELRNDTQQYSCRKTNRESIVPPRLGIGYMVPREVRVTTDVKKHELVFCPFLFYVQLLI